MPCTIKDKYKLDKQSIDGLDLNFRCREFHGQYLKCNCSCDLPWINFLVSRLTLVVYCKFFETMMITLPRGLMQRKLALALDILSSMLLDLQETFLYI